MAHYIGWGEKRRGILYTTLLSKILPVNHEEIRKLLNEKIKMAGHWLNFCHKLKNITLKGGFIGVKVQCHGGNFDWTGVIRSMELKVHAR